MKAPHPSAGVLLALFKRECQPAPQLSVRNVSKGTDAKSNIYFLAAPATGLRSIKVADVAAGSCPAEGSRNGLARSRRRRNERELRIETRGDVRLRASPLPWI